jgi:ADP-dependent phosphofructokinase/glucokinase
LSLQAQDKEKAQQLHAATAKEHAFFFRLRLSPYDERAGNQAGICQNKELTMKGIKLHRIVRSLRWMGKTAAVLFRMLARIAIMVHTG